MERNWKSQNPDENWIRVQKKRLRNRFIGNRGKAIVDTDVKFKAADIKTPIYIYNVSKEVTESDISNYIKNKSGITISLEKMAMKLNKDYDAYKIYIPKHKLDTFLTDDFWPDGIAYRRFVNFNHKTSKGYLDKIV